MAISLFTAGLKNPILQENVKLPMVYVLHNSADLEQVKDKIIPLLEERDHRMVLLGTEEVFEPEEDSLVVTYLNDESLRDFLQQASEKHWYIGILPHPDGKITVQGLGLSQKLPEAIEEILTTKECHKLDLLFCNGQAVFQSLNIGNVFALTEEKGKNFFSEVYHFLVNIRKLPSLSHRPFTFSSDDEKIISTSALGIVAVQHSSNSVVSKRLVANSSMNDGKFNALVLAPENILELLWFLFRSLLPNRGKIDKLPQFIGEIKTSNLKIEDDTDIDFSIDGIVYNAREINLEVVKEAFYLKQKSSFTLEAQGTNDKKSLRIEKLPSGQKKKELTKRKLPIFPRATTEEFEELFKVLRENATVTSSFVVMMILSTLIATFGLFGDSSPVIIGAMILAPIISPIVSFSMGMVRYDVNMLKSGLITILIGTLVSLIFAAGVSLIIPLKIITPEIDARLSPTLLDMGIAVASGVAAAYAHAKSGIAKSLAGVAIAVALVPPLSVAGIGIGWWDWEIFSGAILLYLTNLAGIIMFAGITFLFLGFAPFKRAKMGLIYTFVIIAMVMIPLSISFNRIRMEARITNQLEGSIVDEIILKDVKVRFGEPLQVSLKLVSGSHIESEEMEKIKSEIENRIGKPIRLEIVSAISF